MAVQTAGVDRVRDEAEGAGHGGALDRAMALFGGVRAEWLDLSTGINPWPYPIPVLATEIWTRLPDAEAMAALLCAARDHYQAPVSAPVVAAPGTQAIIQWLPRLLAPRPVIVVAPTYSEHARAWAAAGHRVTLRAADALAVGRPGSVLVLVNPNNPDGRRLAPDRLRILAEAQARNGGFLVVDEAFADIDPTVSLMAAAGAPGLVILRSFGKFFGLAGLRLGFAFGPVDLMAHLAAALGSWPVSGPALAIGAHALGDRPWALGMRDRLARAASRLDLILTRAGMEPIGGTPLFRLVRVPGAHGLADRLARSHILVRHFADHPEWLRFGLPPDQASEARLAKGLGDGGPLPRQAAGPA